MVRQREAERDYSERLRGFGNGHQTGNKTTPSISIFALLVCNVIIFPWKYQVFQIDVHHTCLSLKFIALSNTK